LDFQQILLTTTNILKSMSKGTQDCSSKGLYVVGKIQDEGYVLTVKVEDEGCTRVLCASENIMHASWIQGTAPEDIINKPLSIVVDENTSSVIWNLLHSIEETYSNSETINNLFSGRDFACLNSGTITFCVNETTLCCSVAGILEDSQYLLEFEELPPGANNYIMEAGDVISRVQAAKSSDSVLEVYCDSLMETMTYDRAMVCKFHDDTNGATIIYENIRDTSPNKSTFLHKKLSENDICSRPKTAYLSNGVQYIANTQGKDRNVYSASSEILTLSLGCLCAPDKERISFLSGLGVLSAVSIAIVVNGHLWGLFMLHSYTACQKPHVAQRIKLSMVASIAAMRIYQFEREAHENRLQSLQDCLAMVYDNESIFDYLSKNNKELLELLHANAFIAFQNGTVDEVCCYGKALEQNELGNNPLKLIMRKCKSNEMLEVSEGLPHPINTLLFFKHEKVCIGVLRYTTSPDSQTSIQSTGSGCDVWSLDDKAIACKMFNCFSELMNKVLLAKAERTLVQAKTEFAQVQEIAREHFDFFSHMSHELRSPFHAIISCLQVLWSSEKLLSSNEKKEFLTSALECGKLMMQTLDDILTVAKSRLTTETLQNPVIIANIAPSVVKSLKCLASNKKVRIVVAESGPMTIVSATCDTKQQVETADSEWSSAVVITDETRILHILTNLANNAISHSKEGGTVTIRSRLAKKSDVIPIFRDAFSQLEAHFEFSESSNENYPTLFSITQCHDGGDRDNTDANMREQQITDPANARLRKSVIEAVDERPESTWYIAQVEDNGCGIADENMLKIFSAYKPSNSSSASTVYQGTGLGLHICRTHVQLLHGIMGVASTPEVGSIFMCAVPVTLRDTINKPHTAADSTTVGITHNSNGTSTQAPNGNEMAGTSETTQIPISNQKGTFLIVDDSKVILRLTKKKINLYFGERCHVEVANDGFEAIEFVDNLIQNGTYASLSGIFMDYHMPRCSGLEAIVRIRALEAQHEVPPVYIAAITADASVTSTHDLLQAGANSLLAKPSPEGALEDLCAHLMQLQYAASG
jgi:two-component system, chemotaxis family, sensor kinase Cph1